MANEDVQAVQRSQEFFRLKRELQSPGDIFELTESAKAIYIGPDSDISEVLLTYYNPEAPDGIETAVVSVNGPFVGRLDALNATPVPGTGQPARILVSPVDIVNNEYVDPDSTALRVFHVPAMIDLMVALKPLPDIPQTRADRTIRLPRVPYGDETEATDIIIPIYGRRMITVNWSTKAGRIEFKVATLTQGGKNRPRFLGGACGPTSSPVELTYGVVIRASADLSLNPLGPDADSGSYLNYGLGPTFSGVTNESPFNFARGQADLLILHIYAPDGDEDPNYADIVVRLSDRET